MRLGGREIRTIVGAVGQRRHYTALANMFRVYRTPLTVLRRYAFATGNYPCQVAIRTPLGWLRPTLYSHHDLLTLNEIFCRLDYALAPPPRVVVDVGSNIGLSALFFLSRSDAVRCHLYEPVPTNVRRLEANLGALRHRVTINPHAVGDADGEVEFGIEDSGRYGGIGVATGRSIAVRCRSINDVLEDVIGREGQVDLLKLDTEGYEERTVRAIAPEHLKRIRAIYLEGTPSARLVPAPFMEFQHGSVRRYVNTAWGAPAGAG